MAVVTSDDDLSKGHVEYLEARLIEMATAAGRVALDNAINPLIDRRRLPEADKANMEQFLANLQIILPVIGLDALKQQPRAVRRPTSEDAAPSEEGTRFEIRHQSSVFAEAVEEEDEFVVLDGSEALRNTKTSSTGYLKLKQRLIDEGVLCPTSDERLRFTRSYSFRSPSAASAVVLDRNSNGRLEWKVKGKAMSYADWQERAAADHARHELEAT